MLDFNEEESFKEFKDLFVEKSEVFVFIIGNEFSLLFIFIVELFIEIILSSEV